VLADGPSVLTLLETVDRALVSRGLDSDSAGWDAWKNPDGRWTVQVAWRAGRSENLAHVRFTPGAHRGTLTAVDDAARELIDPNCDRPLRPIAPVTQLELADREVPAQPKPASQPTNPPTSQPMRRGKPPVPAWEDVLLGVRSSGQR